MRRFLKAAVLKAAVLSAAILGGIAVSAPASATPTSTAFGNATIGFTLRYGDRPAYSFGSPNTVTFGGRLFTGATTGELTDVTPGFSGSSAGGITFSSTVGDRINENVTGLFTFTDSLGNVFQFDLTSVTTVQADSNDGIDAVSLYMLGNTSGVTTNETGTPSSVVVNFAGMHGIPTNYSATLSDPPVDLATLLTPAPLAATTDIPEPSSLAVLGLGLAAVTVVRRRRD